MGLVCDILYSCAIDENEARYKPHTVTSPKGRQIQPLKRTSFEAIFTGYDRRSMRESTYSSDVLTNFIVKFTEALKKLEIRDPTKGNPNYPKEFYKALFLLVLDSTAFPKEYLFELTSQVTTNGKHGTVLLDAA